MVDLLMNRLVKQAGLDKYVFNLTLTEGTRPYYLVLGSKTQSVKVWFDVQPEFKDEVELALHYLNGKDKESKG